MTSIRPPTRRWAFALAGVALVTLSLAACSPGRAAVDSRAATQGLPNLLVNVSSQDWMLDPARTSVGFGDEPISLEFHTDRTASGQAPCNAYRGSATFGIDTVVITDLRTTLRSCAPSVMNHEAAYLAALHDVRHVELTAGRDRLVLTTPGGVRLVYGAFHAYDAITVTWKITNVATDKALVTPPTGLDPHVTFDQDRRVTIDAGCGPRSGAWMLDDDQLTVRDLRPSPTCTRAGAAATEAAVIASLEGTHSAQISPTKLTLLTPANTIALVATVAP